MEQELPTLPQHLSSPPYFSGVRVILWRVWRYQRGNQNPYIEEEQTTQWPKEKVQRDKQRSTKHILFLVFHVVFCRSMFDLFVLATVLYVLLWFTDSYYPFGIFKLFLHSEYSVENFIDDFWKLKWKENISLFFRYLIFFMYYKKM